MKPDKFYRFVQELKRRRVLRGIAVYGASTLVLFEAATNLAPYFGKDKPPLWFVALLGVGFFISLWFSWIYDITPGGIKKTEAVSDQPVPIPRKQLKTYKATTFLSVLVIIALLSYRGIHSARVKKIRELDKSIAVLPLKDTDLSPTQALSYDFIGRELTSCLTRVKVVRVIPWDDCRYYPRRNKSHQEMGRDLQVSLLVNWEPYETEENQHLFVELLSVEDASLLWSERFQVKESWSAAICKISRKISKRITRELQIPLTPQERALIDDRESSAQAMLYTSMGKAYSQDAWKQNIEEKTNNNNEFTDSSSFSKAIEFFNEAIEEDPSYAEAYASRAKTKLMGVRAGFFDRDVMNESLEDIEKAFELDADLPEAHVAQGFYFYYGNEEYNIAAVSFQKACDLDPRNTEYLFYLSKINSTIGNWREVEVLSNKVFRANPQNALFYTNLGLSYAYLDNYTRAMQCQSRAIELMPRWSAPYINKAYCQTFSGMIPEARATLLDATENTGKSFFRFLAELDLYEGNFSSAARYIEVAGKAEYRDLMENEGDEYLLKGKIYKHADNNALSLENYGLAEAYYLDQTEKNPSDYFSYSKLGIAFAGLGKNSPAIESSKKAHEMILQNFSAVDYPFILYNLALTYTLTNNNQSALNTLEELISTHSLFTLDYFKIDPDLNPLFDDPGIKNLNF